MMTYPIEPSQVFSLVNIQAWVASRAFEYWLNRILDAKEKSHNGNVERSLEFLHEQRGRIWRLFKQATPFANAIPNAVELALAIDPIMQAKGHHGQWGPIIEGLAVVLDNGVSSDTPLMVANLWRCVARCYRKIGDDPRTFSALRSAEHLTGKPGEQGEPGLDLAMELKQEKGSIRALQMRFEDAERIAHELLWDAQILGDTYTEAHGRTLLAYSYLQGYRTTETFEQAQQAFALWHRLDNKKAQAWALHCMGEACSLSHRLPQARHFLQAASVMLNDLDDVSRKACVDQALSLVAFKEGHFDDAVTHVKIALANLKTVNDERNRISCMHTLGMALSHTGEYQEAELALQEAIDGWEAVGMKLEIANALYALGDLYARLERFDQAHEAFQDALQTADELPSNSRRDQLIKDLQEDMSKLPA